MKPKKILFLFFILFGLCFAIGKPKVNAALDEQSSSETGPTQEPVKQPAKDAYYYYIDVTETKNFEVIAMEVNLQANDDYDGDLTSAIETDDTLNYQNNVVDKPIQERTLGNYPIICSVSDSSGNSKEMTITIVVEDKKNPVIDESSTIRYEEDIDEVSITNQDILDGIVASDEFTKTENLKKEIISGSIDSLEPTKDIEQTIKVKVSDESDNFVVQDVIIILRDRTAPTITTDSKTITVSYCANAQIKTLISSLNVVVQDNYDDEVNYTIQNDHYTENKDVIGNYNVNIVASDSAGNTALETITITVNDTIPPVFYIDESKVFVEPQVTLTSADFLSLLSQNGKIKNDNYEYYVLEDTYTESKDIEGEYNYRCRLSYSEDDYDDFKFVVKVIKKEVPVKVNFFQTFLMVNKKIGEFVWNILRWPILKIKEIF